MWSVVNPRKRTLTYGAIPVVVLAVLANLDHVPGTDISLTVPYAAEGPGPTYDVLAEFSGEPVVEITGAPTQTTTGSLDMTTVVVRHNMSLAQTMGRWLFSDDTIVPIEAVFPRDKTEEEVREINQQAFVDSESAAVVAAMGYLNRPTEVEVLSVAEGSAAEDKVQPGQVLLAIDDTPMTTPEQAREAVQSHEVGDEVTVTLRDEDGTEQSVTVELGDNPRAPGTPLLGIVMSAVPGDNLDVDFHLEDVGGPSAGLIFTLAVVEKLSAEDINASLHVAGTGTISNDGTVGPIGGIQHKVTAAHRDAGAEVFLAPEANCAEALKGDHGDMDIIKVTDLAGAIESMQAYKNGGDYPTCD
ncbi:PDZ domain-containing protein [Corynebacterium sp. TAE3-ERU2]|nr:PDZ domain-containing protein [Corynebacterium sp. TAE3-ERU2]MBV7302883.1 PDZ domain-containing protein [Corynebacterium sp. TAE3-ERU2]